jgi:hypothetical protein
MVAMRLGSAALAAVVIALLLATAAPAAAPALEVAKPRPDQLVTGKRVTVVLHTAPKLRKLEVSLHGKGVRRAFTQVRPGVWRAELQRKWMRTGANVIVVADVDRAGHKGYANGRFYLGERRRGYLTVKAPGRVASSAVASVAMRRLPDLRFRASLNGRNVSGLFRRRFLRKRTAYLGANDGLRVGRNVLKVLAARRDGGFDRERRVIFVRRDHPQAVAGNDRLLAGGRSVTLDGSGSHPSLLPPGSGATKAGIKYHWSVLRHPRGSKAEPASPGAVRTRFRPDLVGTYRLRLSATDPSGARGTDVVTVTEAENAPPIGVPIETMAHEPMPSEEFWIRVGSEKFPLNPAPVESNRIEAVFLDRETLEVLDTATFEGSALEAFELKEEIEKFGKRALVIVSNPGPEFDNPKPKDFQVDAAFGEVVQTLGVGSVPKATQGGWSVIGVPGSTTGGTEIAGTNPSNYPGNMRGYLARGSSGLFSYVASSMLPFDTYAAGSAPGTNRIEVRGRSYSSAPLACASATGGLQVLVLVAETLEEAQNRTFTTNGCGLLAERAELQAATEFLKQWENGGVGTELFFVQSVGAPFATESRPPTSEAEAARAFAREGLAETLEGLGAVADVFQSATSSYAFVGGYGIDDLPLTEASGSLTGVPAAIAGLLQPNEMGSYVPLVASSTGKMPFGLAQVAYQPAQAWPDSETPGEEAALAYVAAVLDLPTPTAQSACYVPSRPDVRSEYCNEKLKGQWGAFVSQLRAAQCGEACQAENGFSLADWENVRTELVGRGGPDEFSEFEAVQSSWELTEALREPFGTSSGSAQVELGKLAAEIEAALAPKPQSEAVGEWLSIISTVVYELSYGEGSNPATAGIIGGIAGALGLAAQYADDSEGSPLLGEFKLSTAELAVELERRLRADSAQIDTLGELIVTDYGKLKEVSENPAFAGFAPKVVESATETLESGSKQWIYQTLFPTAYEALNLTAGPENPALPEKATSYVCTYEQEQVGTEVRSKIPYGPFSSSPLAEYRYPRLTPAGASLGVLVARDSKLPEKESHASPESPPESLLQPIYKPISAGGLGLYIPWFWREAFGFPGTAVKDISC